VIKPAYSVYFLLLINIFVWQNFLYFPNDLRIKNTWSFNWLLLSQMLKKSVYKLLN